MKNKTLLLEIIGTIITLAFAIFNGVFGIIYLSIWYGVFAGYYCVLALQKLLLLVISPLARADHQKQKVYLSNGIILIPLTIALSIVIAIILSYDNPIIKNDIVAITIATYTTYKITMAIINLCKAKKQANPTLQTWRNINLVEALTAIILLESTLISTFGVFDFSMRLIVILSGLAICLFNFALGIYMLVRAIIKLKHCD